LLSDDIEKLYPKSKFADFFDIGVLSITSANKIDPEFNILFKKGAKIHVETCDNVCVLRKEQRAQFREKIIEKTVKAGWLEMKNPPFKHHMLF
jgi:hypothetical protein